MCFGGAQRALPVLSCLFFHLWHQFSCVCEQVAFRINGFHTRPSMAEQASSTRLRYTLGVFSFELDVVFFVNVAGLVISTIVMHSWPGQSDHEDFVASCGMWHTVVQTCLVLQIFGNWLVGCSLSISYLLLSSVSFTPLLMYSTLSNTQLLYSFDLIFRSRTFTERFSRIRS